ncbi:glutathione S-transferase [Breoghania sp. JC706]|uniref:glutathione S-transferase family protein n=1 Tax=Breoghania sp. JC706 TaxID=3117732 RepID=UPI00300808CE
MSAMELWYSTTSPFARKVRVAAEELGLSSRIRLHETNPWRDDGGLRAVNPLCKVPTLVADDGVDDRLVLYESGVICDYLDALGSERRLFPESGHARWRALVLQGLCDGALTAAGRLFAEEQKRNEERSVAMIARFTAAIDAALDDLETRDLAFAEPTIGDICVAVFCGYLDFRWPQRDWRTRRPRLAGWFEVYDMGVSMQKTRHRPMRG